MAKRLHKKSGLLLREFRRKAGITQHELSDALGYESAQFVSNWERGISTPPSKTIVKIFAYFAKESRWQWDVEKLTYCKLLKAEFDHAHALEMVDYFRWLK